MKFLFHWFTLLALVSFTRAGSLQSGEWFIDDDPGEGSGTAISGITGASASLDVTVPTSVTHALSEGAHLLGVRFQDGQGVWSQTVWRVFLNRLPHGGLAQGEHFFNNDPGEGLGLPLNGVSGNTHNSDHTVSLNALTAGANLLGMRFRDGKGTWGPTVFRVFINPESGSRILNRVEFVLRRNGSSISSGSLLGDGSLVLNLSHALAGVTPVAGETLQLELQVVDESGRPSQKVFREVPFQEFSESFADLFFTAPEQGNPAISGDDADPDADGLSNLLEQAFGLHPREPDSGKGTTSLRKDGGVASFTFRSAAEAVFDPVTDRFTLGDLRFEIETASDFSNWTQATALEDFSLSSAASGNADGSFQHVVDFTSTGDEKRFYRLRVTRP